jgi:hypothetical protein
MTRLLSALFVAASIAPAMAQPTGDKVDAKALVQSGVKLFEARDYLGALAVFKDAYARFPSAKILMNIGTTEKELKRFADAANTYQRYLDSPDADPARRAEVTAALAELDAQVGKLAIAVKPDDAEVQIADTWIPAKQARTWRVTPGTITIHARRDGYQPAERSATVAAGGAVPVGLELAAIPKPEVKPVIITVPASQAHAQVDDGPRARFGAFTMLHVSVLPKIGSALMVGATADVTPQLAVDAAVLLGPGLVSKGMATLAPPSYGAYLGASFAFLAKPLRPRASFGVPVFASNGARFAVRVAGGVEYVASRRLSVIGELGFEHNLNPESDIDNNALVPSLAVSGRL